MVLLKCSFIYSFITMQCHVSFQCRINNINSSMRKYSKIPNTNKQQEGIAKEEMPNTFRLLYVILIKETPLFDDITPIQQSMAIVC